MTKRTKRVCVLCFLALAFGAWWLATRESEPNYNGHTLSYWLAQSANRQRQVTFAKNAEAAAAIRAIGTNALPFLVKWLRYEPGATRRWGWDMVTKLPAKIFNSRFIRDHVLEGPGDRQSDIAGEGFRILGPAAAPAIPDLIQMIKAPNADWSASRSLYALRSIGEPALPELAALISDPQLPQRYLAIELIGDMGSNGIKVSHLRPVLLNCCTDTKAWVREAATNALKAIESSDPAGTSRQ